MTMTHDILYSRALTGGAGPSVLMTDAYKFSMAQAGFPLRPETFNLTLRRGGPHFLPFNFAEVAKGNVQCGNVQMSVDAGGNVTCGDVNLSVKAGGNVYRK